MELANSILLGQDSPYTSHSYDPKDKVLLTEKLIHSWRQKFMHVHNIVLLLQNCLACSPKKIERNIAYHFEILERRFDSRLFNENLMETLTKHIL